MEIINFSIEGINDMLSDCPKCWDTPCTCGYLYKDWSDDKLEEFFGQVARGIYEFRAEDQKIKDKETGVELLKTIFLLSPTGKPVKITKVEGRKNKFVIYTESETTKWKHTIQTKEI